VGAFSFLCALLASPAVYALAVFLRASGGAVAQVAGFDPSSNGKQLVGRVGMRHTF
jgi:hypothetical protein